MGEPRVLYAIAESCPFDVLLIREMRRSINALVQLNMRRFRVPEKATTKYSALDVMKQALELLYEFSPSERNYREAMRTIQVYSEGDHEMFETLRASFSLIANAVYNTYAGLRHVESLAPEILFLQGVPFDPAELQQSFRYVGVKPPDVSPPTVKKAIFLDEGFEPYKLLLDGRLRPRSAEKGREEHWAGVIKATLESHSGAALIRAGNEHLDSSANPLRRALSNLSGRETGRLPQLLKKDGIAIDVVQRVADVNVVYGKT